jgi:LacI family transcriptional regulator
MGRKPRMRRQGQVTILDVARLAEVSISTVSRVINQSAKVEPAKRERIEAAIGQLGFAPKAAARALAGRRTRTLGLLVSEIAEDFFVPMLRGIEGAARLAGYELLIKTTSGENGWRGGLALGEHNTDGLLLFADSADPELVSFLAARGFPLVLLYAEAPPGMDIPSVTVENEGGAAAVVEHLVAVHGRSRIVCLTGPESNHDAEARLRGYRAALESRGLDFDPELLAPGEFSAAVAAESISALIGRGVAFDSVFACDDGAALGVIAALAEAGMAVGEAVSVVGFDDLAFASHSSPPLATVRAPTEAVGAEGVRLLLSRIEGNPVSGSKVFPTTFVARSSCGCEVIERRPG